MSFKTVAASEFAEDMLEGKQRKEKKIFKKDASEMFKRMAATIDIPRQLTDGQPQGPEPTLKDQIYSGEILKRMYHRKDVQTNQVMAESDVLFHEKLKQK